MKLAQLKLRTKILLVVSLILVVMLCKIVYNHTSDVESQSIVEESAEAKKLKKEVLDTAIQLVKDFPSRIEPVYTLGLVYNRTGNSAQAQKLWRKCLEMNPQYADAMVMLAEITFDKGQYEQTLAFYQKALSIYGEDPKVPVEIGKTFISLGRFEEAAEILQKHLTKHPGSPRPHNYLGTIFLQLKQYENARIHYEKVLSFDKNDQKAHYGLATVYARLGQKDKSLEHRKRFAALKSESFDKMEEGHRVYDDVLLVSRNVSFMYEKLGACSKLCGDDSKAIKYLKKAAVLDTNNTKCRQLLASLYRQTGQESDAVAVYKNLTTIQPKNPFNYLYLGTFNAGLGKVADAEAAFKKVVQLAPDRPEGYRLLIQLYFQNNTKLPEAQELAAVLVEKNPAAEHYYILALVSSRNGDRRAATAAIKKAMAMNPDNPTYKKFFQTLVPGRRR
ncbi:MAG: tetratricopeptide repeat protein [Planctomycetota bacterium]|jgi:tetratricopeptide (TPR) repeat protein